MLVHPTPKRGFVIECVDGTIRAELFPGTDPQALQALMRVLPVLNDQLSMVAPPAGPAPLASPPDTCVNTGQFAEAWSTTVPEHELQLPTADAPAPPRASAGSSDPIDQPRTLHEAGPSELPAQAARSSPEPVEVTAPSVTGTPNRIEWLSDAIDEWRRNGPIRFSNETWTNAYEPSFRICREILANTRRDRVLANGKIHPSFLDIRLSELTRERMTHLLEQLKLYPERQGKRQDGLEAPTRIQQAKVLKLKVISPSNVVKKLEHMVGWCSYARSKDWITEGALAEFSLARECASARAAVAAKKSGISKPGAVSLLAEELRKVFESQAFLEGALHCDWKYWMGPLRLFTGGRVAELAQLHTSDVTTVLGIPCISIVEDCPTDKDDDNGDGNESLGVLSGASDLKEYRRLKNLASRRVIPVHPKLIEFGFLEWVEQRQREVGSEPELLFAGLTWESKSGFGRKPAEHMLDLLKTTEVWRKRHKIGHSLRANCAQELLRVGMPKEMSQRYLGHSTGTEMEASYSETDHGPAFPHEIALEHLAKMDFGVSFPTYADIQRMRRERLERGQKPAQQ